MNTPKMEFARTPVELPADTPVMATMELKLPGTIIALGTTTDEFTITMPMVEMRPEVVEGMALMTAAFEEVYGLSEKEKETVDAKLMALVMQLEVVKYLKDHLKVDKVTM